MDLSLLLEQLGLLLISLLANLLSALAGGGAGLLQLPVLDLNAQIHIDAPTETVGRTSLRGSRTCLQGSHNA